MHESAISVPVESAPYPPNEGMTLPPRRCRLAMSAANVLPGIGSVLSPFQVRLQDPAEGAWTNAMVSYGEPDWAALWAMPPGSHDS